MANQTSTTPTLGARFDLGCYERGAVSAPTGTEEARAFLRQAIAAVGGAHLVVISLLAEIIQGTTSTSK